MSGGTGVTGRDLTLGVNTQIRHQDILEKEVGNIKNPWVISLTTASKTSMAENSPASEEVGTWLPFSLDSLILSKEFSAL